MPLNIMPGDEREPRDATESGATESEPTDVSPIGPTPAGSSPRDQLISEVVDEMTSWNAKDRMKAFRTWLKGSLSLIHLHVLTVLEADSPIAMSRLADTLDVSVASAGGIIGRMEERGLVERRHDREDRRVVLVAATEAGKGVFRTMGEERRNQL
ncbi:MAG TPA: MarR family winged helix-turn-helix transcriptional regulator, partial [Candidatus Limnocylindrales bacterium]|nr:MarR family winged helix-turn-helix transcriptional regulator [Candidatus Limnocylindrales bacterium]